MKSLLITIILSSLLIAACATNKKVSEESQINTIFQNVSKGDSLFASIYRSPCFGTCPNYTFSIYNSGYAIYEGKRNAIMEGTFTTQLTVAEMKSLVEVANSINYNSLEDEYDNENVTDLPSTITSIVIDGKRKSIKCRLRCPAELRVFQNAFDRLAESKEWMNSIEKQ
jgi:hypothetical protein